MQTSAGVPPPDAPGVPLRLLLVSQPTVDGVAACVAGLAAAGVAAGLDVTVACPQSGYLAAAVTRAGARWERLEMQRRPGPADLRAVGWLRHRLPAFDVAHLHSSKAGAVGRLALASLPAPRRPPCVFTPHGWSWLAGGALVPLYRRFEAAAARLASVIVAVGPGEADAGRAVLGRWAGRVRVIENGVDLDRFAPVGPTARRDAGPLLVCVGRLSVDKGQDLAVRALASMRVPARLRLVGDGPDRSPLEALAAELGVADRVEFLGHLPDPAPHLRAADVVLVPSRWEGLALTLLEPMGCGAAVVATACSGAEVLDGGAGVVVPAEDPLALARAADSLLADEGTRSRLGAAARVRAVERFDHRRSSERNIGLWMELARRGQARSPT